MALGKFNTNQNFCIINSHGALLQTGRNRDKFSTNSQTDFSNNTNIVYYPDHLEYFCPELLFSLWLADDSSHDNHRRTELFFSLFVRPLLASVLRFLIDFL